MKIINILIIFISVLLNTCGNKSEDFKGIDVNNWNIQTCNFIEKHGNKPKIIKACFKFTDYIQRHKLRQQLLLELELNKKLLSNEDIVCIESFSAGGNPYSVDLYQIKNKKRDSYYASEDTFIQANYDYDERNDIKEILRLEKKFESSLDKVPENSDFVFLDYMRIISIIRLKEKKVELIYTNASFF